jgi:cysteine desulfurase / selenocysteine lyase
MLDPKVIQADFPILKRQIKGQSLVYLDNASTTQKPQSVIDALTSYYANSNANIHRGVYTMSEESTAAYEATRSSVSTFLNAHSPEEIIFTRNTTESINLVAYSWGEANIQEGDEIIVSEYEHHSNFIPWQQLAIQKKAKLKIIPIKSDYTLDLEAYKELLTTNTKLVAITGISNVTGYRTPLKKIITAAHKVGALTLVDAAQLAAHQHTDVQELNCDFLALSAHKMLGPTGIGVLYGKKEHLEKMPPFNFGGSMIKEVQSDHSTWADLPAKFEAGTQNIADVVAFKAALDYLEKTGLEKISEHEKNLTTKTIELFSKFPEVTLYTPPEEFQSGIISFNIKGAHPHDIASIFNEHGIAIRSGHHCCQPLMRALNTSATARISFYLYNSAEGILKIETATKEVIKIFS